MKDLLDLESKEIPSTEGTSKQEKEISLFENNSKTHLHHPEMFKAKYLNFHPNIPRADLFFVSL